MTQTFDHLFSGVWSYLDESQEDRITRLYMPKWVSYDRANEALARMGHLLRHPPSGRMPSMLLYGDSDIYTSLGLFGLAGNSLSDNGPLRALIGRYLSDPMIDEIAAEFGGGEVGRLADGFMLGDGTLDDKIIFQIPGVRP